MDVIAAGNLPSNRVLIGGFPALQILVWGIEVQSNPYTFSLEHNVALVINLLCDIRVSRAAAFIASTDSGAV